MTHPASIGRYTILSEIGRGGMGTVYLALDSAIDRRVAIKFLRQDVVAENPEVLDRLWVEARAANLIGHPGVVQVSEVASLDGGTSYLVMEYLEGQTLSQRMHQRGGRLPVFEAIQYAVQIASTLNAGHKKGIIHRDLKPSNVMLVPDDAVPGGERVKLLDFGIAKIPRLGAQSGLTLTNISMGTPGYMAPEQLRDAASASDRSDVYALAAVLYEMLAGRPPHMAPNAADLIATVLGEEAPPITQFEPTVPKAIERLLEQMLRRQAIERPTMTEVLREFVLIAAPASGQTQRPQAGMLETPPTSINRKAPLPPAPSAANVPSASTPSQLAGQRPPKEAPSSGLAAQPWRRALYVGVLCGVIGFGAWMTRHREPPNSAVLAAPPSLPTRPAPPPPAPPVPPPAPTQVTVAALTPTLPPAAPKVENQPPPSPRSPAALVKVTLGCLRPSNLPPAIKHAVASAAFSAGMRVTPAQAIALRRQGDRGFVFAAEHERNVSEQMRSEFESLLRRQLRNASVPPNLHRIIIQCGS